MESKKKKKKKRSRTRKRATLINMKAYEVSPRGIPLKTILQVLKRKGKERSLKLVILIYTTAPLNQIKGGLLLFISVKPSQAAAAPSCHGTRGKLSRPNTGCSDATAL